MFDFVKVVEGFGFYVVDFDCVVNFCVVLMEVIICLGFCLIYVSIDVDQKVFLMVFFGVVNYEMIGN